MKQTKYSRKDVIKRLRKNIKEKSPVNVTAEELGVLPVNLWRFMREEGIRLSNNFYLVLDKIDKF